MKLAAIPLVLLALFAPSADAATVTDAGGWITFADDAAEDNRLEAVRGNNKLWIRDSAVPIRLTGDRGRCVLTDAHAVECTGGFDASIDMGGGNDVAHFDGSFVHIEGGAGVDELTGDSLSGGPGDDRLHLVGPTHAFGRGDEGDDVIIVSAGGSTLDGGPGRDVIRDGDGNATVFDEDAAEHDDLDLGGGTDTISYIQRTDAVGVDLAEDRGGAGGIEDRLMGIEDAYGGGGDDLIRGDDEVNRLGGGGGDRDVVLGLGGDDVVSGGGRLDGGAGNDDVRAGSGDDVADGGPGDDHIDGGAGPDALFGGDGADQITGGPGDDVFEGGAGADIVLAAHDRFHDRVACGDDADVAEVDDIDAIDATCESVTERPLPSLFAEHSEARGPLLGVGRRGTMVLMGCPSVLISATIEVRRGGTVLGRGSWTCGSLDDHSPADYIARVEVRLPATIRRAVRRGRRLRVTVNIQRADGSLPTRARAWLVRSRIR